MVFSDAVGKWPDSANNAGVALQNNTDAAIPHDHLGEYCGCIITVETDKHPIELRSNECGAVSHPIRTQAPTDSITYSWGVVGIHRVRVRLVWAFIFLYFSLADLAFGQAGSISLSSGTASGGAVSLNVDLSSPVGSEPAALQWTFTYPPANIVSISAVPGAAVAAAGKSLSCAAGYGVYTCLVWGLNSNTISNGSVAIVSLIIAAGAAVTSIGVINTLGARVAPGWIDRFFPKHSPFPETTEVYTPFSSSNLFNSFCTGSRIFHPGPQRQRVTCEAAFFTRQYSWCKPPSTDVFTTW